MRTITTVSALAVTVAFLLSGCSAFSPFSNGQDEKTISDQVASVEGVERADVTFDDTEKYNAIVTLTVDVHDDWYVADTAEFADYLVREAWSFATEPDRIRVVVTGGVPENFDWYDSLVSGSPSPEWSSQVVSTFSSLPEPTSVIEISNPGYILIYDVRSPGPAAQLGSDVLKKGAIPEVTPSAVLDPSVRYNANSEVKSFQFHGQLNTLEDVPYRGIVSVVVTTKDGTAIAKGIAEAQTGRVLEGQLTADLPWVYDGNSPDSRETYYFTISMTPQDGFDTEDRTYPFIVLHH